MYSVTIGARYWRGKAGNFSEAVRSAARFHGLTMEARHPVRVLRYGHM